MLSATVEAPQITEQMRKLEQFDQIAQSEFRPAMDAAIALSVADIRSKAPVMSGNLTSAISGAVKFSAGDEVRGVMTADVSAPDGFRYGYALDTSKRFHYAGRRKSTKGFFKGVIFRKRTAVMALFFSATSRIVARLAVSGGGDG